MVSARSGKRFVTGRGVSRVCPPTIGVNWKDFGPTTPVLKRWLATKSRFAWKTLCEPYYFTEKMVGAAQAGCIPIYRAHPTVRETFLVGAKWVDPADFGFDAGRTLDFALRQNLEEYQEANGRWLQSAAVQSTRVEEVFRRIGDVLSGAVLSPQQSRL